MDRRVLCCAIAAALLGALGASPAPAQDGSGSPDRLRAFSIVPPGQEGDVTVDELGTGDPGPDYDDQREMYASLVDDRDVTEAELNGLEYFHSMQFGTEEVRRGPYAPGGSTSSSVVRDDFGIPHIEADSLRAAAFALGYVSAEDRMWQMDVFRHAARGTLSELVGPGENDEFFRMDVQTRREGYTGREISRMLNRLDDRFEAAGRAVQRGVRAYADGVNAHIQELKTTRADELPVEYGATGNPPPANPEPWEPADTLFLAVLQLRVFGETAGGELENAALYSHLRSRLGTKLGARVYNDFLRRNDPRSPTSIPASQGRFPSQALGPVDPASVAIPDHAARIAAGRARAEALRSRILESWGFRSPASNALLVSARESATGNPLQIGAPQVGYAVPSFFMDVDVHAPGVDFRGPAVPGASALIPLGRGPDYAWSLTTGYSDAVDTRAELLCDPGPGRVARSSNHYVFRGRCRPMSAREETFIVKPTPTAPGAPRVERRTFYRTVHGPVSRRGTVDGRPVAFVTQRFFWKKEIDSLPPFYRWNTKVGSVEDFRAAARMFTMSFNALYADARDIGYFHVGHYPIRPRGVSPSLPTWGTGRWEWRGRLPFGRHPQVVNPRSDWVANWNNKPARGWDNMDGIKWGPIHRVSLLQDGMRALLGGPGKARLSDLVDVIRSAATRDARGVYLGGDMAGRTLRAARDGSRQRAASLVRAWVRRGAHRTNRDRGEHTDQGAAVAIFDRWYRALVHEVFDDELGRNGYELVPAEVAGNSFWFDYSSYLENVLHRRSRARLARNYCDDVGTRRRESCRRAIVASLGTALDELSGEQGRRMSAWRARAWWINFSEFGAGSVDRIPWQNRGTHNHVVEVLG
ncbi:MAG: penicillin acylase family protein, partial [Actinomycetota bacterium]